MEQFRVIDGVRQYLLLSGRVRAPSVTALTAHRRLAPNAANLALDELSLLNAFALPQREFEAEVMADSLTRAFGLDPPLGAGLSESAGGLGAVHDVTAVAPDLRVGLLAVPKLDGATRADTVRTLTYWADEVG